MKPHVHVLTRTHIAHLIRPTLPPIYDTARAPSLHKGAAGRIAILGRSQDYAGAPYFAAMAALRCGADLAYVFCAPSAAAAIKAYSPELMVTPCEEMEVEAHGATAPGKLVDALPRLHALVVGPGLGRKPQALRCARAAMQAARQHGVPLVVDADGLYALHADGKLDAGILAGYPRAVLTPNAMEVRRLCDAAVASTSSASSDSDSLGKLLSALRSPTAAGEGAGDGIDAPVLCLKGSTDKVLFHVPDEEAWHSVDVDDPRGAPKRCGGQGDILAGCIGTFLGWSKLSTQSQPTSLPVAAVATAAASVVVRSAAERAFARNHRATGTVDILNEVGEAFHLEYDMLEGALSVAAFARYPVPGKCKTRLAASLLSRDDVQSAEIANSLACDVYRSLASRVIAMPCISHVFVSEAQDAERLKEWCADIRGKEHTVPLVVPQVDDKDLGRRMHHALTCMTGSGRAMIVGTDVPGLTAEHVQHAARLLDSHDVVLGPAYDGGYYLVAVKHAPPVELFEGIEWSTSQVREQQVAACLRCGLSVSSEDLPVLRDVDTADDLSEWHDKPEWLVL